VGQVIGDVSVLLGVFVDIISSTVLNAVSLSLKSF
jgi:hypothetical protein